MKLQTKTRKILVIIMIFIVIGYSLLGPTVRAQSYPQIQPAQECKGINAYLQPDGSLELNITLRVTNPPPDGNLTVTVEGTPLYAQALTSEGIILPLIINNNSITISVNNYTGTIYLNYLTADLTKKTGLTWYLNMSLACKMKLVPPQGFILLGSSPDPKIMIENGNITYIYNPGPVSVKFTLAPPTPPPRGGGGGAGTTTTQSSTTSPSGGKSHVTLIILIIILVIVIMGGAWFLLRSRKPATPRSGGSTVTVESAALDKRDKAILEALRGSEKGLTASELMERTGIPRTPLYRRLNRLVRSGIIEYYDEGGVRRYRIRKG
jgi:uncharacterized membrane protein